jgi:hypothetical protein
MYGLGKEKGKKQYAFDLERKIHEEPKALKEILETADQRLNEVKKSLREGADEKEFNRLGVLLQGYTALQKVLRKAGAKK